MINIVNRKLIVPQNRIDAEFYKLKSIHLEDELVKNGARLLSELCDESDIRINPTKEKENYFRYIEITDVNLLDGSFFPQIVLRDNAPSRARKICRKNEIIVSTVRPNRNAVAIVPFYENEGLVCSTGFCVLRCKEKVSPEEVFIFLKSKFAILQLTRRMRATMYPAVANIDITSIRIPKISVSLKNRIIKDMSKAHALRKEAFDKLRKIDTIVENLCNSLLCELCFDKFDNRNNIKTTLKSEIFGDANRIDPQFYRPLYEEINGYLEKYKNVKTLGNIFKRVSTGKTPAKSDYRDAEEDSVPIIKVGTLTNSGLNWSAVEYASIEFFEKNKGVVVKNGDIVFTSSAHSEEHICKKVDIINEIPKVYKDKCLFVGELMLLRGNVDMIIEPYYIVSFLRSSLGRLQVQRCARGISSHVYNVDIKKYVKVPIPNDVLIKKISKLAHDGESMKKRAINVVRDLIKEYEEEVIVSK